MFFELFFIIAFWIAVPVGIIWGLRQLRKKGRNVFEGITISSLSHLFLTLSVVMLGVALFSLMREGLENEVVVLNILFVVALVGFILAYVYRSAFNAVVWFLALLFWWMAKADTSWIELGGEDIKGFALLLGVLLVAFVSYVLGAVHRIPELGAFKNFSVGYYAIGSIILGVALYAFSTHLGIDALGEMLEGVTVFESTGLFFSLVLFTALLLGLIMFASSRGVLRKGESMVILGSVIVLNVLLHTSGLVLTEGSRGFIFGLGSLTTTGLLIAAILNILLFSLAVGLILWGERDHTPWKINAGILVLGLVIVTKYFDWFFSFLDKSIFFIGAGILLLGLSFAMEKKRRSLLSEIEKDAVTQTSEEKHVE